MAADWMQQAADFIGSMVGYPVSAAGLGCGILGILALGFLVALICVLVRKHRIACERADLSTALKDLLSDTLSRCPRSSAPRTRTP